MKWINVKFPYLRKRLMENINEFMSSNKIYYENTITMNRIRGEETRSHRKTRRLLMENAAFGLHFKIHPLTLDKMFVCKWCN